MTLGRLRLLLNVRIIIRYLEIRIFVLLLTIALFFYKRFLHSFVKVNTAQSEYIHTPDFCMKFLQCF